MCGRYIANSEDEITEIREILKQISMRLVSFEVPESGESGTVPALSDVFPTNQVLLINKTAEIIRSTWGLEKWDKKGVIINAKSETCEQSGFFKPFANNRCIIPAHGYYEWRKPDNPEDKQKIKYAFSSKNKHGIFMAGLYKTDTFAIITKPAEEEILFIHPRMPLIISAEQAQDWLSGKLSIKEAVLQQSGITFKEAG
ncbi:MAG: SOS response-associated peptidase [Oscillospiraceae bacterium]|nr:SOS response-associated peptidase [Oscillospiraceae bacterium]